MVNEGSYSFWLSFIDKVKIIHKLTGSLHSKGYHNKESSWMKVHTHILLCAYVVYAGGESDGIRLSVAFSYTVSEPSVHQNTIFCPTKALLDHWMWFLSALDDWRACACCVSPNVAVFWPHTVLCGAIGVWCESTAGQTAPYVFKTLWQNNDVICRTCLSVPCRSSWHIIITSNPPHSENIFIPERLLNWART